MKNFVLTLFLLFVSNLAFAKEPVNVAFTIDNNYVIPTMISIDSIIKNSKSDTRYKFYIVESGLTRYSKTLMKNYIEKFDNSVEFVPVDTDRITKGINLYKHLTPIAIARVVIPEIIDVDKVIYLDGDTLITGDLSELYNIDLEQKSTGMVNDFVEDLWRKRFSSFNLQYGFYNSGMILIDSKKWRELNLSQKIIDTLHSNLEKYQRTQFADQIIISEVLGSQIKPIHPRWNNQCYSTRCVTDFDMKNGGIYHYIVDKPWNRITNLEQTSANLAYINHWKNSEFKNYIYFYLWRNVENIYLRKISIKGIKSKYFRYFEILKKHRQFPKFPLAEFNYILNGK